VGEASRILAGATVDITTEGILLVLGVLALLAVGGVLYVISIPLIIWRHVKEQRQNWFFVAIFVVGTLLIGAYTFLALYWSQRPQEPELAAALEVVVAESIIDDAAFSERGVQGRRSFERNNGEQSCANANAEVWDVDWATDRFPTDEDAGGLSLGELLESEAQRLERAGWTVNRFVDNNERAWQDFGDPPFLVANDGEHTLRLGYGVGRLDYRLSRILCQGDVVADLLGGDFAREVEAFLVLPGSHEDALLEAEELLNYHPSPGVPSADYSFGYGTNQLCASAVVVSPEGTEFASAETFSQVEGLLVVDGWEVDEFVLGNSVYLLAERDGRVVVAYRGTTGTGRSGGITLRGYPEGCADPSFVLEGYGPPPEPLGPLCPSGRSSRALPLICD